MRFAPGIAISLLSCALCAQPAAARTPLAEIYEAAWQRQPAAQAWRERERAQAARSAAAASWTAAPPVLEMSQRSDRFNRRQGAGERELGLALPLWLPGERGASGALVAAEGELLAGDLASLRLQLAQRVREAWWAWRAARNEEALLNARLQSARRLRDDVAHRFAAGDLARADLNQADGALALAEALQAEAQAAAAVARYRLEALGGPLPGGEEMAVEPEPASGETAHPALRQWQARAEVARRNSELTRIQSRANPELALSTRSDVAASGQAGEQSWALALRLPFGGGPRHDARLAQANAEAIEATVGAEREAERLAAELAAARLQVQAMRAQVVAAERRARLAQENRGFYDKSFRLGESDLPTRLRIEAEAFEAERALGRARIALAQGISQWRQALGLLPE